MTPYGHTLATSSQRGEYWVRYMHGLTAMRPVSDMYMIRGGQVCSEGDIHGVCRCSGCVHIIGCM